MYLTCPNCQTVYAVRAAMLRDGQGEVRCGTCRLIFNALDSLSDDLPTASAKAVNDTSTDDGVTAVGSDKDSQQRIADRDAPKVHAERSEEEQRDGNAITAHAVSASDVPAALRGDLQSLHESGNPPSRHVGLWVIAVAGLLALAFQYLWFAPEDLARRFPLAKVHVEKFCLQAGCMTREERAPDLIRVLNRDVRAHPRYEGALLITATFSNAATWAQPFPGMRFSLYDVNGRTIAARTFSPTQYLAGVLPADAPLPPGQPVQVSLEMLAPEEAAVSFEFTFL